MSYFQRIQNKAASEEQLLAANTIQFAKTDPLGIMPKKSTEGAIGFDVYSPMDVEIKPETGTIVPTYIAMELPEQFLIETSVGPLFLEVGLWVLPRSSMPLKGIYVSNSPGLVDRDYLAGKDKTGIGVILENRGTENFQIKRGDRIAQFVFVVSFAPVLEEIELKELGKSTHGGFGSTGV